MLFYVGFFLFCRFLFMFYFWLLVVLNRFHRSWLRRIVNFIYFEMRSDRLYHNGGLGWIWRERSSSSQTSLLNPIENGRNNGFRIKPMYLLNHLPILVIDSRIRERSRPDIAHTKLRIPLTIEIINLKAPLFFMFKLVHNRFEISTVGAMWGEVLHKFEGKFVFDYFGVELRITDQVRIGHKPVVCD